MSRRADKQQRRRRRKQRDQRGDVGWQRQRFDELLRADPSLQLLEYDIVDEPMVENPPDPGVRAMSGEQRERIYDQLTTDPKAAIGELEPLLRQHPDSRTLRNWLCAAYGVAGDHEAADRLTRETYERFPDYLFARMAMAEMYMQRGEVEQVPLIFDNKFDLKLLYPHRNVFHLSEYMGFSALVIQYFMRIGEREAAENLYEIMCEMAPDHPITEQVGNVIVGSVILRAIERLTKLTKLRPRQGVRRRPRARRVPAREVDERRPQLGESA